MALMISDRDTRWKFASPSSTTTSLIEQKRNLTTCGLSVDRSQDTALCQRMSFCPQIWWSCTEKAPTHARFVPSRCVVPDFRNADTRAGVKAAPWNMYDTGLLRRVMVRGFQIAGRPKIQSIKLETISGFTREKEKMFLLQTWYVPNSYCSFFESSMLL